MYSFRLHDEHDVCTFSYFTSSPFALYSVLFTFPFLTWSFLISCEILALLMSRNIYHFNVHFNAFSQVYLGALSSACPCWGLVLRREVPCSTFHHPLPTLCISTFHHPLRTLNRFSSSHHAQSPLHSCSFFVVLSGRQVCFGFHQR